MGPSSAGAIGWMQFMPSTWLRWGTDADGDGVADPWDATDAIHSAARYLAAAGGQTDIRRGVFASNPTDWYVDEVLGLAGVFDGSAPAQTADLQRVQAALQQARRGVARTSHAAAVANQTVERLRARAEELRARAGSLQLLSDRLAAERAAVLFESRVQDAIAEARSRDALLAEARQTLATATREASAPSFTPAVGTLMAAPSYSGGYVFPVGGGPQVVSVAHVHHDYPAADIAAPQGSPLYALSDGEVLRAWNDDSRCGIGFEMRTSDGLSWTYCHLAYREPSVEAGARLAAGDPVGLVGSTGNSTGPHLHLGLQHSTLYPQQQPWFQSFAGSAFRWQGDPPPLAAPAVPRSRDVFAVEGEDDVVFFNR
jgi:murein DD-endopeptidase MepM/ murein hydrolase activator NlpD